MPGLSSENGGWAFTGQREEPPIRRSPRLPTGSQRGDRARGRYRLQQKDTRLPDPQDRAVQLLFSSFVLFLPCLFTRVITKIFQKPDMGPNSQFPASGRPPAGVFTGQGCTSGLHRLLPFPSTSALNAGVNSPCWCVGPTALLHL